MSAENLQQRWAAVHGAIFLGAFALVVLGFENLFWPWHLVLPLAGYAVVVAAIPVLRRSAPRLALGRMTGAPLWCAIGLSVATTLALWTFHRWAQPDVASLAAGLPVKAFGNLILAGIVFSLVNAALEELIFRGILYEAVLAEWGAALAIAATAALFGWGHRNGYPPGWLGAVLAGGYGIALGLLRWWTGGLGLALAAHVCADATIFSLLASSGAFGTLQVDS